MIGWNTRRAGRAAAICAMALAPAVCAADGDEVVILPGTYEISEQIVVDKELIVGGATGKPEDVVIHEMIHYYIGVNGLKDTSAHGQVFRCMMNDINERYNRNITISHKSTKEQKELLMDTRRKWHVIAIVHFHDGRTGIKVLPRIKERIANYCRNVGSSRETESIDLYFSDNPFFNRYPCSSAFNVIFADRQTIEQNISDAKRLVCKGTDICLLENN